jgi:hypothetical protein
MSLTIELSAETETAIKELAARNGCQPEEYAQELLNEQIEIKLTQTAVEDPQVLSRALQKMKNRTPSEISAVREKMFRLAKPPRSLPKKENIIDVIYGKLPDDESDHEVFATLQKLS